MRCCLFGGEWMVWWRVDGWLVTVSYCNTSSSLPPTKLLISYHIISDHNPIAIASHDSRYFENENRSIDRIYTATPDKLSRGN